LVHGQRFRWRHRLACCTLVILAALLLVATGILLGRSVVEAHWPAFRESGLLQELVASLLSLLSPEGFAGIAVVVAAGSLWAAFRAVAGYWPTMAHGDYLPEGSTAMEPRQGRAAMAPPGFVPDPILPGEPPEQLRALAEQASILADSLAASVANAARAVTAGSQADAAAGQGAALLTQMQTSLTESLEQMQQASGRLMRLAAYCRQADDLLAALQERAVAVSPQPAGTAGAGVQPPAFRWDAFRQDFKQLAILTRTMDMDARDSYALLEATRQEVGAATQLAQQSTQAVAEIGRAAATLAEEVGLLYQVAQAQAETCGEHAATCASIAGLPMPAPQPGDNRAAMKAPPRQFASI
jgi:hypothetical protein